MSVTYLGSDQENIIGSWNKEQSSENRFTAYMVETIMNPNERWKLCNNDIDPWTVTADLPLACSTNFWRADLRDGSVLDPVHSKEW